jgi:hypothetical protein
MTEFIKRDYRPTDENFVVSMWLRSYAHSQLARRMSQSAPGSNAALEWSWSVHRPIVSSLLYAVDVKIEVVCAADAEDVLLAYACTESDAVHYAGVKMNFVADFGREMMTLLFGDKLSRPMRLSHEPVWTRHVRETKEGGKGAHVATDDRGYPLPAYYQKTASFFPLPTSWKLDENYLARKWCPVRAA